MARPILTARWSNVCILTYSVPPESLQRHLPAGVELDARDGQAFVSLVGLDFRNSRVWGVPCLGYGKFTSLNFRFYVKRETKRGVVFLRELVPGKLVAWTARLLYGEPFAAAALSTSVTDTADSLTVDRRLRWDGRSYAISVTGGKPATRPAEASAEHFFKERYWGFGTNRQGQLMRFEVRHPVWQVYPLRSCEVDLDWGHVYGPQWAHLSGQAPCSGVLAAGSEVAVFPRRRAEAGC